MTTNKEQLIIDIDNRINELEQKKEKIAYIPIDELSEIFPEGNWSRNFSDIEVYLPYSFPLIEKFKMVMSEYFPQFVMYLENNYVWNDIATAMICLKYRLTVDDETRIYFEVNFSSQRKGSTCVLNPIGKKTVTKEEIEYEVVCSQEAAEEFGIMVEEE